jgi:hypothetical protein
LTAETASGCRVGHFAFGDGRVTDIWTEVDGVGMMEHLGVIPA